MKTKVFVSSLVLGCSALLLSGCASPGQVERGPQGTIAYSIAVEASEPEVRIEANNELVGMAPVTITVFGDRDGTFHNFGSQEYVIKAYPKNPAQSVQTKVFRTGGWFSQEDQIPKRLYFDMNQKGGFTIDRPSRY